jgi:peptidoglycan/LPS O-acetylase OafA/YrhL
MDIFKKNLFPTFFVDKELFLTEGLNTYGILYTIITLIICIFVSNIICRINKYEYKERSLNRLGCIDGLRGYLALGVFFHHFIITYIYQIKGYWCVPPSRFFTNIGQAGPVLFFMITGFLFFHRILNRNANFSWANLYISRFFRLVPLYWSCVAVISVIVFVKKGGIASSIYEVAISIMYWLSFFGNPDINKFTLTWRIIAGVTWTLKYEWLFYFSLPFLSILTKSSIYSIGLLSVIILILVYYSLRNFTIPSIEIELKFFLLFFLGGLSAYLNQFGFLKKKLTGTIYSIIASVSLIFLLFFFDTSFGFTQFLLLFIFFLPVSLGNSIFGIFNKNFSILLGEMSYSIYLIHGLILYASFSILCPSVLKNISSSNQILLWMVIICLATIIISWLTYSLIERTFINLGKFFQIQT